MLGTFQEICHMFGLCDSVAGVTTPSGRVACALGLQQWIDTKHYKWHCRDIYLGSGYDP